MISTRSARLIPPPDLSQHAPADVGGGSVNQKHGPLVGSGLGPDPSPVTMHDALDVCEAQTDSGEILRPVQALEDVEKLSRKCHVETDAVVADEEGALPAVRPGPELDDRPFPPPGELPGVLEEVFQRGAQQAAVAVCAGRFGEHE